MSNDAKPGMRTLSSFVALENSSLVMIFINIFIGKLSPVLSNNSALILNLRIREAAGSNIQINRSLRQVKFLKDNLLYLIDIN